MWREGGGGVYLWYCLQYLSLSEILRVLHWGGENSLPSRPSEHVQHDVPGRLEGRVEVQLPDGVVGPVRRDDGGEDSVLHVRQSAVLVRHEVDEGWLSCLENPEVPDARSDPGSGAPAELHLRHPDGAGAADEGVAVLLPRRVGDSLPGVGGHLGLGFGHPGVLGDEVSHQNQAKLLGAGDSELLGEDVHRVLLTVSRDDILVVPSLVVLGVVQSEEGDHLQLPDGVHTALLGHVQDLHTGLGRQQTSFLLLMKYILLPSRKHCQQF